MKLEFELTVKIKGNSLEDVDNGLIQAAGQRLLARLTSPPQIMTKNGISDHPSTEGPKKMKAEPVQYRAIKAVYEKKGKKIADDVLKAFEIETIADLKEKDIEEFVQLCNSHLAGA
jgi:hypothetical protein